MSAGNSTAPEPTGKPDTRSSTPGVTPADGKPAKPPKPSPDFPLFAHATGRWAKKIAGKLIYFGRWDDPQGALREYQDYLDGKVKTKSRKSKERPDKPTPDFPLFAHAAGYWAKKVNGATVYFGPWSDPQGALQKYEQQRQDLEAGRKPKEPEEAEGLTIKALVNKFLNRKKQHVQSGELTQRSWDDYNAATDLLIAEFKKGRLVSDLGPDDFAKLRKKMAKKWGPVTLGNVIQRMRVVFKFGYDDGLIDRPVRYGQGFKRPTRKTIRLERARKGAKLFTADEIKELLDAAGVQLRAFILLGINAAFGNSDCGRVPTSAVNLLTGWVDFPRPKTGIPRRCWLWDETRQAIREAIARRPEPRDPADAGLLFITKQGYAYQTDSTDQTIAKAFGKLLRKLHINGRKGLGFYTLRHTFRTVADEAKDQIATDHIMGHEIPNMSAAYRETISDARLKSVGEYVRQWLFAPTAEATQEGGAK